MQAYSLFNLPGAIRLGLACAALGAAGAASGVPTTRVIVAFQPGTANLVKSAVAGVKGRIAHEIAGMNAVAVEATPAALERLQKNPGVLYVEEDAKRYLLDTSGPSAPPYLAGQQVPYGVQLVQADQLPDENAANRKVCIIDSGYDRAHEDLSGNEVKGEFNIGTGWWYKDDVHHGTHVAGTIAAINNAGVGVVGINPNRHLKLHIVKVFTSSGWTYASTLASAANKCRSAGANVISMSLGGPTSTRTEQDAFAALEAAGILSVAAAGNDGSNKLTYPAGYPSVMMVAAVEEHAQWASFSQYNAKVEIAAPGVNVLSTVPMNTGSLPTLSVGETTYAPRGMDGSPRAKASAPLADFGLGDAANPAMAGKVCLIARGTIAFGDKVANCQSSGGVAAVIFNNAAGGFGGTLGTTATRIPSVTASDTEGAAMLAQLGQAASMSVAPYSYASFDGTSMATPHVSAVAALVWSYFPSCTAVQIRASLVKSALDLGDPGRDDKYGHGLVQAKAAYDRIKAMGCGN
jgi:subtilisin family serine protease